MTKGFLCSEIVWDVSEQGSWWLGRNRKKRGKPHECRKSAMWSKSPYCQTCSGPCFWQWFDCVASVLLRRYETCKHWLQSSDIEAMTASHGLRNLLLSAILRFLIAMLAACSDRALTTLQIATSGRGLHETTRDVLEWVRGCGIGVGLLTLFVRHTSASLLIQENADPDVRGDLDRFFARLVPEGDALFRHRDEGPNDMPAHVRAAFTATHLSIPVDTGRVVLGTWQGIYLWEHRLLPHHRELTLHLLSE